MSLVLLYFELWILTEKSWKFWNRTKPNFNLEKYQKYSNEGVFSWKFKEIYIKMANLMLFKINFKTFEIHYNWT